MHPALELPELLGAVLCQVATDRGVVGPVGKQSGVKRGPDLAKCCLVSRTWRDEVRGVAKHLALRSTPDRAGLCAALRPWLGLTDLKLEWCSGGPGLPLGGLALTQLVVLEAVRLTTLVLPPLPLLRSLIVGGCRELTRVGELSLHPRLEKVSLTRCKTLRAIPAGLNAVSLVSLDVSGCVAIGCVDAVSRLTALKTLRLSGLDIDSLDVALRPLAALTALDCSWCDGLTNVDVLQFATGLVSLNLTECCLVDRLDGLACCKNLTELDLVYCEALTTFALNAFLPSLASLTRLDLGGLGEQVDNLDGALGAQWQPLLSTLGLSRCHGLSSVAFLREMTALTVLDLSYCVGLESLDAVLPDSLGSQDITVALGWSTATARWPHSPG